MQVFLVEEAKKLSLWKRLLKPVEIKGDIILLNGKCKKMKGKRKLKIVQNIRKKLGMTKLILSKELKQDKEWINLFYSNEFDIVNGKKLCQLLMDKIVDKVCEKNHIKMQEAQISIAINDVNQFNMKWIEELSEKFKLLNIVTNHIHYFKKIVEKLWLEKGIVISVTSNKKKALSKSNMIVNIDFPEELLNQYSIYENSVLVNIEEKVKIKKKRFNGKIINDYKISFKKDSNIASCLQKEKYKDFDLNDLAEIYIINSPKEIEDIIIC